jgi:hypothetical protein
MPRQTAAQVERQRSRDDATGRYTEHIRCEFCGKNAGPDYYSLPDCNETGRGVTLCKRCAAKGVPHA